METLNFAFVLQNSLLIGIRNPNLFVVLRSTLQYSTTPILRVVYPGRANLVWLRPEDIPGTLFSHEKQEREK